MRPVDENWWEVFRLVEREADLVGRRVLDVGCGTGRLEVALAGRAKVWGLDAEPAMLEVARESAPEATFKLGRAESLPFKDGWFERAVMWLSAHLLDRPVAFAERGAPRLVKGGALQTRETPEPAPEVPA